MPLHPDQPLRPCSSLPGFPPNKIEVTAPKRLTNVSFATRLAAISPHHITRIGVIPVTDGSRTLLDLCATATDQALEDALDVTPLMVQPDHRRGGRSVFSDLYAVFYGFR